MEPSQPGWRQGHGDAPEIIDITPVVEIEQQPIIPKGPDTGVHQTYVTCTVCNVMWSAPMPDHVRCGRYDQVVLDDDDEAEFVADGTPTRSVMERTTNEPSPIPLVLSPIEWMNRPIVASGEASVSGSAGLNASPTAPAPPSPPWPKANYDLS